MRKSSSPWRLPGAIAAVLAGAVPLVLLASVGAAPVDGHATPRGGWQGLWLSGTTSTTYNTTLADIRTIIGASTGTGATLTGQGVGIALIDTGVVGVPGLPAAKVINGPDLSFESQAPTLRYLDGYGHGTHLAGIMVGNDTATGTVGLAPGAKLTSIKVSTANGAADVTQVIAAIDWVVQHRTDDPAYPIRVLNLSYGSGGSPNYWTDPLMYAVEQAWKAGITVVVAAGNQGNSYGKLADPAEDPWVIAVGATTTKGTVATGDDALTTYTNINLSRFPDIAAPGESVISLRDPGSNIDITYPTARVGETLFRGSGTSQAAAVTSAACALLLQYRPSLTPDMLKQYIKLGRTQITNPNGIGEVSVNGAIASMNAQGTNPQVYQWAYGNGAIEAARGSSHITADGVALSGEKSIFGAFNPADWAAKAATKTTWSGGVWMGYRMAGDGWNGTSWASKTWGPATWPGQPWSGAAGWTDPSWGDRTWTGNYWFTGSNSSNSSSSSGGSGGTPGWSSRYWAADNWAGSRWS